MKRALLVAAASAGLLAGAYLGVRNLNGVQAAEVSTEGFYAQSFPDAGGKTVDFSAYRGKVVVVNFWATWCEPCVEEIPEFSKLSAEYKGRNVQFIGIGIDNAKNIAEFQQKIASTYPLVVAGSSGSDLVRQYGDTAGALPYTLILDEKGAVRARKLGRVTEAELRDWLKAYSKG